jgi:hypothetical protein
MIEWKDSENRPTHVFYFVALFIPNLRRAEAPDRPHTLRAEAKRALEDRKAQDYKRSAFNIL